MTFKGKTICDRSEATHVMFTLSEKQLTGKIKWVVAYAELKHVVEPDLAVLGVVFERMYAEARANGIEAPRAAAHFAKKV